MEKDIRHKAGPLHPYPGATLNCHFGRAMARLPMETQSHSFFISRKNACRRDIGAGSACKIILRRKIKLRVTLQSNCAMVK